MAAFLHDGTAALDPAGFEAASARAAGLPLPAEGRSVALLADNGIDWLAAAAGVARAGGVLVPLPGFFTDAQCRHAAAASGAALLLTDDPARGARLGFIAAGELPGTRLHCMQPATGAAGAPVALPAGTALVTFTSGTTGAPRGVCLGADALGRVSGAVAGVATALGVERHLCLLPLGVLLEQVAGAGAAALAGATAFVPPLATVGMAGSSGFDARRALAQACLHEVHSLILLPQMLQAMVAAVEGGAPRPSSLRIAAVGGGRVPPALVARARALGIPACEGYGLSECGSVVALALPEDAPGSGMRPLPHVRVRTVPVASTGARSAAPALARRPAVADASSAGGEVVVEGPAFLGYLGGPAHAPGTPVHTGDLGTLDPAGALRITGRLRHLIVTGFGRNVSPEWPESELLAQPQVLQAVVFGEARPWLCAVLVPAPGVDPAALADAVAVANAALPDYARIGGWIVAATPFTPADGTLTANGRPRREVLQARHATQLEALYPRSVLEAVDVLP